VAEGAEEGCDLVAEWIGDLVGERELLQGGGTGAGRRCVFRGPALCRSRRCRRGNRRVRARISRSGVL